MPTLETSCHCSSISITAPHLPSYLNECQCSICRRYGAQWAYYKIKQITFSPSLPQETTAYAWGDKTATFEFCQKCGCILYWISIDRKDGEGEIGINARLVNSPETLKFVERRITYEDAVKCVEGLYDEKGPIRKS